MGTYVTETGFQGKTQSEIITELEDDFKEIFGNDIDLDSDSGFGQLAGVFSKQLIQPWDGMKELYTCVDPNHATGVCLDNVSAINNITRLPETATFISDVILEGDEGTVVATNKKIKKVNNTLLYSLVSEVTISKTTAAKGVIEVVTVVATNTYTVTINSINYDYVAQGGDTKTDILDELETLILAGSWTGAVSVVSEQLLLLDTLNDFSFDFTGDLSIEEIWSKGDFQCDDPGSNSVPANTLVEISTPVTGWNQVINLEAGLTGREIETDDEFRLRRAQSLIQGNATDEAIRSNIFNNVSGVTSVKVTSNRTNITDIEGRPANSFESVVEGGTDEEVAAEILERQPAGIESFGNTTVVVVDSQGNNQNIKFSRPEDVFIFVQVKRSLYSEETYPTNGDSLIKSNIVNWSLVETNISVGIDVITTRVIPPVYGNTGESGVVPISGIEDVEIELDSSTSLPHTPSYAASNIPINARQKAVFTIDRIVVTTL